MDIKVEKDIRVMSLLMDITVDVATKKNMKVDVTVSKSTYVTV